MYAAFLADSSAEKSDERSTSVRTFGSGRLGWKQGNGNLSIILDEYAVRSWGSLRLDFFSIFETCTIAIQVHFQCDPSTIVFWLVQHDGNLHGWHVEMDV